MAIKNTAFSRNTRRLAAITLMGGALAALSAGPAAAQLALAGKTVTIYAAGGVGGGVDSYARLLAIYLTRHLPGQPSVVVSNMPGAGGMQALQYLYNVAPKDGTAIGTTNSGPISEPQLGTAKVNYEIMKFNWIGSLAKGDTVCAFWHESAIYTVEDLRTKGATIATTGVRSAPTAVSLLLNSLIGTRLKPIAGYSGGGETLLAMERREVDGNCVTLNSLRTTRPDWLRDKKVRIVVQVTFTKAPEYPDVPLATDFLTSEESRQMLELYLAPYEVQNPFMLPPDTPKITVDAYRKVFDAAVADKDYLADAAKRMQTIVPKTGAEVERILARMAATPEPVLAKVKAAINAVPD